MIMREKDNLLIIKFNLLKHEDLIKITILKKGGTE